MKSKPDSDNLLNSYKRVKDLELILSNKENLEWQKLIHSPESIRTKLHEIVHSADSTNARKECEKLIKEIDELIHLAAHHKYFNGQSVKIWSVLKSIQDNISKFSDSLQ